MPRESLQRSQNSFEGRFRVLPRFPPQKLLLSFAPGVPLSFARDFRSTSQRTAGETAGAHHRIRKCLELPMRMARSTAHLSTGFHQQLHHSTSRSTAPPAVHHTLAAGPVILKYDQSDDIRVVGSWRSGASRCRVLTRMQSSIVRLPTACEPSITLPTRSSSYVHSQSSSLCPSMVLDLCAVDALG